MKRRRLEVEYKVNQSFMFLSTIFHYDMHESVIAANPAYNMYNIQARNVTVYFVKTVTVSQFLQAVGGGGGRPRAGLVPWV